VVELDREDEPSPPRPHPGADTARRRLRFGTALAVGGAVALSIGTSLEVRHVVGLPLLMILLPALSLAQAPLLDGERLDRHSVYLGSMVAILALGALSLLLAVPSPGLAAIGIRPLAPLPFVAWTTGMAAAGMVLVGLSSRVGSPEAGPHDRLLLDLLPRTGREKRLFAGLSLSAGLGEELAFRGYALAALQLLSLHPWIAALATSAAFGMMHAYQGVAGTLRTALVGGLLAASVLKTGSILPAMAAHALVDLGAGLLLGPRLIARARDATGALDRARAGG